MNLSEPGQGSDLVPSREHVVVVGAAGFGRECLDVLEAMSAAGVPVRVVGVVDDGPSSANLKRLATRGVEHLGSLGDFIAQADRTIQYVLGIGHPGVRRSLVERLDAAGFTPFTAIHPSALMGSMPSLNEGVVICAGAVVSTNIRFGRHVHVNPSVTIGHDSKLKDFVSLNPGSVISGEVVVGSGTLIGASATVLQGLTIGSDTIVGAAALVTHDVPSGVVVKGVPGTWS